MVIERARVSLREYSMRPCPGLASTVADPGDQGCRAGDSTGTNAREQGIASLLLYFPVRCNFRHATPVHHDVHWRKTRLALASQWLSTHPSIVVRQYSRLYTVQSIRWPASAAGISVTSQEPNLLCPLWGGLPERGRRARVWRIRFERSQGSICRNRTLNPRPMPMSFAPIAHPKSDSSLALPSEDRVQACKRARRTTLDRSCRRRKHVRLDQAPSVGHGDHGGHGTLIEY
jgi:hypothetical protein